MVINRRIVKKAIGFIAFFLIFVILFLGTTYFFRLNGTSYLNRENVIGIKNEGPLDMVYVGSSEVFVYYNAWQAYDEYGYTSYAMATEACNCEAIKYYVKEVLKNQKPSCFVIGASGFLFVPEGIDETSMRKSTDSLDYDLDRFRLINDFYDHHDMSGVDKLSLYLDIIKYHTNYDAFKDKHAYGLVLNRFSNSFKGFVSMYQWESQTKIDDIVNDDRVQIDSNGEEILIELLDYLKSEDLNVLFTFSPVVMDATSYSKCNYITDIIESYGFETLNLNAYYDEMGLVFEEDFYNSTHVNSLGAEKYTRYVGKYVSDYFNLPDHRGEEGYGVWDNLSLENKVAEEERRNIVRELTNEDTAE